MSPTKVTNSQLPEEIALEEVDGPIVDELRGVAARKPMALTFEGHILDGAAQLTKTADHLVGFPAWDARIVVALEAQQRTANIFDVGDRGALDEHLVVGVQRDDPH